MGRAVGAVYDAYAHDAANLSVEVQHDMAVTATDPMATPVGYGQRIAHLHAVVAVNQARHRREQILDAEDAANGHSAAAADEFAAKIEAEIARVEAVLGEDVGYNRDAQVARLAQALLWKDASPTAAEVVEDLTGALAREWGVLVDVEGLSVGIDAGFDADLAQARAEADAIHRRVAGVVDVVSCSVLPGEVKAVVGETAWSTPDEHDLTFAEDRGRLGRALADAGVESAPSGSTALSTTWRTATATTYIVRCNPELCS